MKKNLSLILAVVMLISVLGAFPAYAADINNEFSVIEVDLSEQGTYVVEPRVNKDFVVDSLQYKERKRVTSNYNFTKDSFTFTIKSMGARISKVQIIVKKTSGSPLGDTYSPILSNGGTWTHTDTAGGTYNIDIIVVEGTPIGSSVDSVTVHIKDN